MAQIRRRPIGRNQIWWLADGIGAHGAEPKAPGDVVESLQGKFSFTAESPNKPGLRAPQLGALHAVLAHETMESEAPVTIVMPTGTGKTETMLAAFANDPKRTLIIVPSNSLRAQIATKFVSLGVLPALGALSGDFLCPVVGLVRSAVSTAEECTELLSACNVIIATPSALSGFGPEARSTLVSMCDQLFVDEAHHIAARTWRSVADLFAGKTVVQFTATPFREDGQFMGGRLAYAYPLRLAQKNGYFAPINYHSVSQLGDTDHAVATAALIQLRADLADGLDHVLMARVQTVPRAGEVLARYQDLAPDLQPVRIDSKMSLKAQVEALTKVQSRESRIVVCVDMLGEGFDLPALKVAAIHDPHKSLAITLQFVGRFARVGGDDLGEASVFVPRPVGGIDERLRRLYGEDADWNSLIRDLTQTEVEQEQARTQFEAGFGALPQEVAVRSLQPKMSTVIYRSTSLQWNPDAVYDVFPESELLTKQIAINAGQQVVWFVTEETTPVPWGDISTIAEVVHHLYVVHCDTDAGLMYINSSNNDSLHEDLAHAVGGGEAALIRGDVVYRVLAGIRRRVPTNVGLLDAVNRNRRFTMHVGADVLEGFGPGAAQKSKTNIFAHGYSDAGRVSFGASRKGRVWSHAVAHTLLDWVKWARSVGAIVTDESIQIADVMSGFIIPTAAMVRPPLVPLGIEWPYELISNTSEVRKVEAGGIAHPLLDLDLSITDWQNDGPIRFEVRSDDWAVPYEMTFGESGPVVSASAVDAHIVLPKGVVSLAQFMTDRGLTVFFEQEALLSPDGYLIQPNRARPQFAAQALEVLDWTGIDIRKESQGATRDDDSVQHRVIESLAAEANWEVILDDDGKGEVADAVFLRRDEHLLEVVLAHCKFSATDAPGARVGDIYEVCGQAVKSHKARSDMELVLRKLLRREGNRQAAGRTGFVVGDTTTLLSILDESRMLDVRVTVVVAQPGLSQAALSNPVAEVLACTELYLSETYNSRLRVMCSP
jgi:superfamily II DNA or RNA helicase